ncbi:acyl-CoA dehydrogenase [Nocardia sp. ET3-3]|uniref:Acyl-CoA dehydrogenase n=1 Tax=Nocardia terrae TaxID=2675851 RepID=A0A7K1UUY9_9NOCA|nr:acyl-CoA dehydrogenase [Nocardia terrae]
MELDRELARELMGKDWVREAESLVDEVLAPRAGEVDRTGVIPSSHFEALARRGFYGFPLSEGMSPQLLIDTAATVISGCLATGFVWAQHLGALRSLLASDNEGLRGRYLADMLSGGYRCGVSYAGARTEPTVFAEPVDGGYVLGGATPFVTGWGYIDAVAVAARADTGASAAVATLLVPVREPENIAAERLPLIAADASATVRLAFTDTFVASDRVLSVKPVDDGPAGGVALSDWVNGGLALGVLMRCVRHLKECGADAGPHLAHLEALRERYGRVVGDLDATHAVRAEIAHAAVNAAAAGVVATGSRSVIARTTAERLVREATFALVATTRDPIKAALSRAFEPSGQPVGH